MTSAGLAAPSWFSVSGSPVTSSGTLTLTAAGGQAPHQVIGTCGAATSFGPCALAAGDLPSGYPYSSLAGAPAIDYQIVGNNGTSQTARSRLNLIPGANVTLNVADNAGTNSTDVTINASTGGGGSSGVFELGNEHGNAIGASATAYLVLDNGPVSVATSAQHLAPKALTLSGFFLTTGGTQSSTGGFTCTVLVNGTATSITLTVPASSTANTFSDVTHTAIVNAGDHVVAQCVNSATAGTTGILDWSLGAQ